MRAGCSFRWLIGAVIFSNVPRSKPRKLLKLRPFLISANVLHKVKIQSLVRALLRWYSVNARDLPWRREPYRGNPYCVYVSEIMLQQTQVKAVIPYFERWMRSLPSIQAVARARSERIHKLWEGLGYYTRVRNLQKAARFIVAKHGGKFPENFEDVLALPGIGPYTAGAICSIAFHQPKPVLDGNVIRVLTRLFGITGNPRLPKMRSRLWKLADELVLAATNLDSAGGSHGKNATWGSPFRHRAPGATRQVSPACSDLNQSLMELGALICTPKQAKCGVCPLARLCSAYLNNRVQQLPNLSRRPTPTRRRFMALVAQKQDRFLVRRRGEGIVNAHLWEFPNAEILPINLDLNSAAVAIFGISPENYEPLCTIKHTITRYRITLEVFRLRQNAGDYFGLGQGRWLKKQQLRLLPFTNAHKQILDRLITKVAMHKGFAVP